MPAAPLREAPLQDATLRDAHLRDLHSRNLHFRDADAAWLWAASVLRARQDPAAPPAQPGPCRVEDVVKCLDVLYRAGTLELLHVRILRIWGWRGLAPRPGRLPERCDWRLWREATEALDGPLRRRGIVDGPRCALPAPMLTGAAGDGIPPSAPGTWP